MKLPALSFILLFSLACNAQVVIDSTDVPIPGDTIIRKTTYELSGFNYTSTDSNYIWDFSALTYTGESVDTFVSVLGTNLVYLAVFYNPFDQAHKATVACMQPTYSPPLITITNSYNFYKRSSYRYSQVGMGSEINGIPIPSKFDNPEVLINFPVIYGNIDSSISSYHLNIPGLGYYGETRNRKNTVDGWGVLYLPNDTFDVMRIKSQVSYFDSVYIDTLGFGFGISRNETEYRWLSDQYHEEVLKIVYTPGGMGGGIADATFFFSGQDNSSIKESSLESLITVSPNPCHNNLRIGFIGKWNGNHTISLFSLGGTEVLSVFHTGNDATIIDVSSLPHGIYILQITDGINTRSSKVIIN